MPKQSFRVEGRKGVDGALVAHLVRDTAPETSIVRPDKPKHLTFAADGTICDQATTKSMVKEAKNHLKTLKKVRDARPKRGPKASGVVEFLAQGPVWTDGDQAIESWAADTVRFVADRIGAGSRIAVASLHLDEASPHLHIYAVVANTDRELGWNKVKNSFNDGRKVSGRYLMTAMQDSYHKAVGVPHGLERGERGSGKVHRATQRDLSIPKRLADERAAGVEEGRALGNKAGRAAGYVEGEKAASEIWSVTTKTAAEAFWTLYSSIEEKAARKLLKAKGIRVVQQPGGEPGMATLERVAPPAAPKRAAGAAEEQGRAGVERRTETPS